MIECLRNSALNHSATGVAKITQDKVTKYRSYKRTLRTKTTHVMLEKKMVQNIMSCKCSNWHNRVFDNSTISFNAANTELMFKIGIIYQYASRAVCTYAHIFWKRAGCVLIVACALIRTNTVNGNYFTSNIIKIS